MACMHSNQTPYRLQPNSLPLSESKSLFHKLISGGNCIPSQRFIYHGTVQNDVTQWHHQPNLTSVPVLPPWLLLPWLEKSRENSKWSFGASPFSLTSYMLLRSSSYYNEAPQDLSSQEVPMTPNKCSPIGDSLRRRPFRRNVGPTCVQTAQFPDSLLQLRAPTIEVHRKRKHTLRADSAQTDLEPANTSSHALLQPAEHRWDSTEKCSKSRGDKHESAAQLVCSPVPSGSGKQPVTRCWQCGGLFLTLLELNAHFSREHAVVLQKELHQTKSWKSHAVQNMCVPELKSYPQSRNNKNGGGGCSGRGSGNSPGSRAYVLTGYPCPFCGYLAKWPTELQKHIMVHSKERPHRCVICGLSYKWKWDLGRHFDKSHSKSVNPYKKNCFSAVAKQLEKRARTKQQQQHQQQQQQQHTLASLSRLRCGTSGHYHQSPRGRRKKMASFMHSMQSCPSSFRLNCTEAGKIPDRHNEAEVVPCEYSIHSLLTGP